MASILSVMTLAYHWVSCSPPPWLKGKPLIMPTGLTGFMWKDPEEPFSQECLLNKILRVNRKQMCVVWALLQSLTSTTCECTLIWGCFWNANRKRKWNSALDLLSAKSFYKGLQWSHHRTKLNHIIVLAFVRCTPQPYQIHTTPFK